MKKSIALLLAAFTLTGSVYAADENITVTIDGSVLNDKGVIVNDHTLLPVREIYETFGYTVDYDAETKSARIYKGEMIELGYTNNSTVMKNGKTEIEMDVPAQIINNKFMMPVRSLENAINLNIDWDGETKTVNITRPNNIKIEVVSAEEVAALFGEK